MDSWLMFHALQGAVNLALETTEVCLIYYSYRDYYATQKMIHMLWRGSYFSMKIKIRAQQSLLGAHMLVTLDSRTIAKSRLLFFK